MVRAQADRAVRELARGQWQVHSVFSHAINLANDRERRLLLLAPTRGARSLVGSLTCPARLR
ncbi:hypothetical protein LFLT20_01770 [Limosilactobacillus fermentum]|nr:hypothetical protein LFLT20_01770 [Limosilactobacillus fermentum]